MFSINDTLDTGEQVEIQIANYSEVGHKHEISDVNNLENRLASIEEKLSQLMSKAVVFPDASTIDTFVPSDP